jgi:hypothetical protein
MQWTLSVSGVAASECSQRGERTRERKILLREEGHRLREAMLPC